MNESKNKLNVGVIGTGAISDIYLENMGQKIDQLELVAISSKHFKNAEEKRRNMVSRHSIQEKL